MPKEEVTFTIDGKECKAAEGQTIVEAARANGIYVPTLCYSKYVDNPVGACRSCTVKINGNHGAACVNRVQQGMDIQVYTRALEEMRKAIVEALFVEGNHFCPACEKSGDCELQAAAYRLRIMSPRFPYRFPLRHTDFSPKYLVLEHNRCILCQRCVQKIRTEDGKKVFAYHHRGGKGVVQIDPEIAQTMSKEMAMDAAELCPVGCINFKGKGFDRPIGTRKYDKEPINKMSLGKKEEKVEANYP